MWQAGHRCQGQGLVLDRVNTITKIIAWFEQAL